MTMPEGTSNSVINLGDLSKPSDTLIKKVSKAVGGLFAPYQIKRLAKAEAEAAIIKLENQIEITDLHRRAMRRFLDEEARRQENIEVITAKAIPQLTEGAKPDAMEDDWVTNFFDKSRIVSDSQMQDLWARVLAGEANAPGTYSRRTVNSLSDLDKTDAQLLSNLCCFAWHIYGAFVPLVVEPQANIYKANGVTFESLGHLESIGLIQFHKLTGFSQLGLPKPFAAEYYGRPLLLVPLAPENRLDIGKTLLTNTGRELAPLCGGKPVEGFWEYSQAFWEPFLPKSEIEVPTPTAGSAGPDSAGHAPSGNSPSG